MNNIKTSINHVNTKSKRSHPKTKDTRYLKSEHLIRKALHYNLRTRQMGAKTTEICKTAAITRPTFYAHYTDVNDALHTYEKSLQELLQTRLPDNTQGRNVVFTILLGYIYDYRGYFKATIPNYNYWVLRQIFDSLRSRLASDNINDQTYEFYAQMQIIIISDWYRYNSLDKAFMPHYAKKMTRTRMVDPRKL